MSSIAVRFGVTAQAIMDANGMSGTIINVGMELIIPSGGSSVAPPPSPSSTQTGPAPTSTTAPPPAAPTATKPPPTPTTQTYQYEYVDGTMQGLEKGCSDLGVEGVILDATGKPVTDRLTVRWQLGSHEDYWVTGSPVEKPGVFKFIVFPGPIYHGTKTSTVQIVESESNPSPLSEPLTWQVLDCVDGPEQFVNITFRRR